MEVTSQYVAITAVVVSAAVSDSTTLLLPRRIANDRSAVFQRVCEAPKRYTVNCTRVRGSSWVGGGSFDV